MRIEQIRTLARRLGIEPGRATKTPLIRAIQLAEGNFDCFATAYDGECSQTGCMWREDCFATARKAREQEAA